MWRYLYFTWVFPIYNTFTSTPLAHGSKYWTFTPLQWFEQFTIYNLSIWQTLLIQSNLQRQDNTVTMVPWLLCRYKQNIIKHTLTTLAPFLTQNASTSSQHIVTCCELQHLLFSNILYYYVWYLKCILIATLSLNWIEFRTLYC